MQPNLPDRQGLPHCSGFKASGSTMAIPTVRSNIDARHARRFRLVKFDSPGQIVRVRLDIGNVSRDQL
jgi:hypothetical protein